MLLGRWRCQNAIQTRLQLMTRSFAGPLRLARKAQLKWSPSLFNRPTMVADSRSAFHVAIPTSTSKQNQRPTMSAPSRLVSFGDSLTMLAPWAGNQIRTIHNLPFPVSSPKLAAALARLAMHVGNALIAANGTLTTSSSAQNPR